MKLLLIPCGFSLELPKSFEAQVRPRSGIALKNQVTVLNTLQEQLTLIIEVR